MTKKQLKKKIDTLDKELSKYLSPVAMGKVYDFVNYNILLEQECNK